MRVASFHEPDEFDEHFREQKVACQYVGTFAVDAANTARGAVLDGMRTMLQYLAAARPATLFFSREGIKVIDTAANKVAMAHALTRISMATADEQTTLFGFVAKNPKVADRYCHVFNMPDGACAQQCQGIVMKAFGLAFAARRTSQRGKRGAAAPAAAKAAARAAPAPAPPKPAAPAPAAAPQPRKQWAKHNPMQGVPRGEQQGPAHGLPRMSAQIAPTSKAGRSSSVMPPAAVAASPIKPANPSDAGGASSEVMSGSGWYQPGIPREIAMEMLEKSVEGSFVVRDSSSQPGHFAMTIRAGGLMHHYIIRKVPQGVVLGSEDQGQSPLPDLPTLIIEYSRTKGCLPCVLSLETINSLNDEPDSDDDEDDDTFVDPDYQAMKDFRR
jgi:hypothetical protein